jgi:hypothetical protein
MCSWGERAELQQSFIAREIEQNASLDMNSDVAVFAEAA